MLKVLRVADFSTGFDSRPKSFKAKTEDSIFSDQDHALQQSQIFKTVTVTETQASVQAYES